MKTHIKDGLQIFVALLFTGSTAYAMQPTAAEVTKSAEVAVVQEANPKPKPTVKPSEKPAEAVSEQKTVTWQDNPNKCDQNTQFIAEEAPFKCIDKPKAAPTVSAAPAAARSASISGTKEQWMAAAGIPSNQWHYVDSIVSRESGWNPCAYNPGLSDCNANPTSACGLAQSLPCGKQSKYGHWTDPVANLKWQYEYVTARYGGYAQAVAFWNANHWY